MTVENVANLLKIVQILNEEGNEFNNSDESIHEQ